MRPILFFAIYAVVVIVGMTFVSTDQLTAGDAVLFLTPVTGLFAVGLGFTLARR